MKKLLNTLYVLTPDSYLFCRNETICVKIGEDEKVSIPALSVDSIVCFGKNTVSTPLIAFCAERGISLGNAPSAATFCFALANMKAWMTGAFRLHL